jgi:hypothetical protein
LYAHGFGFPMILGFAAAGLTCGSAGGKLCVACLTDGRLALSADIFLVRWSTRDVFFRSFALIF